MSKWKETISNVETRFDKRILGATILLERHYDACNCSYCIKVNEDGKKLALWLPESKESNAWRVIFWKKDGLNYYLRSTLPKWKALMPRKKKVMIGCDSGVSGTQMEIK